MRLKYCFNPVVCSIAQGETRLRVYSTEQESEYHPVGLALAGIGMGEAFILEGSADGAVFELSIEQILAPSLQAGQIVILDNLQTHTGDKVRLTIEARG